MTGHWPMFGSRVFMVFSYWGCDAIDYGYKKNKI
jgi:hypothetical protein